MARRLISIAALCVLVVGCVPQDKYNALKVERDQLNEQLGKAETDAAAANASAKAFRDQLDALLANNKNAAETLANLTKENAELKSQLANYDQKLKDALANRGEIINVVNPELSNELEKLAAAHPELMEYDKVRGVIKLKGDVSFAKGSAELTPQARQVIGQLASILNSTAARNYEFQLVGHTDSQPVSNPVTIRAGHKDNWFLSAHRAISVEKQLAQDGVGQYRMGVAGYAEQRPIASNTTSEGMSRNRRVEVLILPSALKGGPSLAETPTRTTARRTPPAPRRPAIDANKDTAVLDSRPVINDQK